MLRVILAGILVGAVAGQAVAAFWDIELVYDGGFGAGDCSLALDGQGVPRVSYTAGGVLYVATKTLSGWNAEPIQSVGYWGGLSSIALDTSDRPCVAFVDSTDAVTSYLSFARKVGTWSIERVGNIGWWADHVSLAVNRFSQPCIAFCRTVGSDNFVSFARRLGQNQWSIENIASVGSVTAPSLAFNGSGTAFVAFVDLDSGLLKVARNDGRGWSISIVDGGAGEFAVAYPYVTISPDGNPVVTYFVSTQTGCVLKLALYTGSSWHKQTIARFSSPVYSAHCASLITSTGLAVVVFQDPESGCLKGAWRVGSAWIVEEIDAAFQTGERPSIRCNGADLYLGYFDGFEFNVKLARAAVPLTLQQAKSTPDGSMVEILGLTASTSSEDFADKIYAQSIDRIGGLALLFGSITPAVSRGDILDVRGVMSTINGERVLVDPVVKIY